MVCSWAPSVTFELLYVFIIVRLARRDLIWINVKSCPTADWITRQITEAFSSSEAPRHLVRDRDQVYGTAVTECTDHILRARRNPSGPCPEILCDLKSHLSLNKDALVSRPVHCWASPSVRSSLNIRQGQASQSQQSAGIPVFVNRETSGRSFCAPQGLFFASAHLVKGS
jgi:hypothetical protein